MEGDRAGKGARPVSVAAAITARLLTTPRAPRRRVDWHGVVYHQEVYARTVAEHLSPGTRWLDLGAGTRLHGWWGRPAPEELARVARPIGCDPLPAHLRQHPHLRAGVAACGESLPFPDGSLDLVSANMVLEHLADPGAVFREVARVLRPGGHFIVVTPNRRHWIVGLIARLLTPRVRSALGRLEGREPQHIFPTFYRANTVADLQTLGESAGFHPRTREFASLPVGAWFERLAFRLALPGPGSNLIGVLERE